MTGLRVAFDHGSSYQLLMSLATVADPRWREVFASAPHTLAALRAPVERGARGAPPGRLLSEVASLGRYGWINLASLVAVGPSPRTLTALQESLVKADAEDLHLMAVGARRRQLLSLIDEDSVRAALRGDVSAKRDLARALSTDQTVLTISPWLRRASSEEVKHRVLAVTEAAGALLLPTHAENVLRQQLRTDVRLRRRRLSEAGPAATLAEVAEGLTYAPSPAPSRVVLIPAPAVRPIVVVVDEVRRTLIFHPAAVPLDSPAAEESKPDLLSGTRALGDETRLAILEALRSGERSATDLAFVLAAPRTTLLHHLALLRAAGLIETSVGSGNTTVYGLRSASIAALSREIGRLASPTVEKSRQ